MSVVAGSAETGEGEDACAWRKESRHYQASKQAVAVQKRFRCALVSLPCGRLRSLTSLIMHKPLTTVSRPLLHKQCQQRKPFAFMLPVISLRSSPGSKMLVAFGSTPLQLPGRGDFAKHGDLICAVLRPPSTGHPYTIWFFFFAFWFSNNKPPFALTPLSSSIATL